MALLEDDIKKLRSEKLRIDAQNAKLLDMNQKYALDKEKLASENEYLFCF